MERSDLPVRWSGRRGAWGLREAPLICAVSALSCASPASTDWTGTCGSQCAKAARGVLEHSTFPLCFQEEAGLAAERGASTREWERASLWELKFALLYPR